MLSNPDPEIRISAVFLLCRLGLNLYKFGVNKDKVIPYILETLQAETNPSAIANVAFNLGWLGSHTARFRETILDKLDWLYALNRDNVIGLMAAISLLEIKHGDTPPDIVNYVVDATFQLENYVTKDWNELHLLILSHLGISNLEHERQFEILIDLVQRVGETKLNEDHAQKTSMMFEFLLRLVFPKGLTPSLNSEQRLALQTLRSTSPMWKQEVEDAIGYRLSSSKPSIETLLELPDSQ